MAETLRRKAENMRRNRRHRPRLHTCTRNDRQTSSDIPLKSDMGLVSSNGSIPGLVGKILADPMTLRKVTSESIESLCIIS